VISNNLLSPHKPIFGSKGITYQQSVDYEEHPDVRIATIHHLND